MSQCKKEPSILVSESEKIFDRIKKTLALTQDKDVADYFNETKQQVYQKKYRGIPMSWLVKLKKEKGISLDFLLFGERQFEADGDRNKNSICQHSHICKQFNSGDLYLSLGGNFFDAMCFLAKNNRREFLKLAIPIMEKYELDNSAR